MSCFLIYLYLTKYCVNTRGSEVLRAFLRSCCCCRRLTWTTLHLCELIHCCLEQLLAPLRPYRPCKTWSLCWMSSNKWIAEYFDFTLREKAIGIDGAILQQCGEAEAMQVFWMHTGLSQHHIFCPINYFTLPLVKSVLNHVFDSKNNIPLWLFFLSMSAFGHISWLVLLELTRHLVCIVIQRGARKEVGTWSNA